MSTARREPCATYCPCLCHDGYGGAHPGVDCRGRDDLPVDPTAEPAPDPRVLTVDERRRLDQIRREWTWYEMSPASYHATKFLLELLDRIAPDVDEE